MKNVKKVGIMGGTFNPIHNGHLTLAQYAQKQIGLDKVLFMPSGISYMKKNVLDPQKRADMVHLAIKDNPVLFYYGCRFFVPNRTMALSGTNIFVMYFGVCSKR